MAWIDLDRFVAGGIYRKSSFFATDIVNCAGSGGPEVIDCLAQVGGRPTALERWPDGVSEGADHFFKDDEAHMKPMIETVQSYVKRRLTEGSR